MAERALSAKGRWAATIIGAPAGGAVSYFVAKVLEAWGALDGLAFALGGYLKTHVSPAHVGWALGLIVFASLYGLLLRLVWHSRRPRGLAPPSPSPKPAATPSAPPTPKPSDFLLSDDLALVERVRQFATHYLKPATEKAHEAQRRLAYAFKDAWSDTPAGKWGYTGILTSASYSPSVLQGLTGDAFLRSTTLDGIQRATLDAVQVYAIKTHRINDLLRDFKQHGKVATLKPALPALQDWWKIHEELLVAFERLKGVNGLPMLRDYKMTQHLIDPKYSFNGLEDLLNE